MSSEIGSSGAGEALPRAFGLPVAALAAGLVFAVTLGATWLAWATVGEAEARSLRADFEYRVRDAERRVEQRMASHEQVLHGAAGLFAASREVERAEFRDYVATLHLEDHAPGIQGVGFSLLVPAAALDRHTREVQRQGFPGYAIRPPGPRDPYSSIVFLEPFSGRNLRAFGYDMLAEPVRREAMERARDEGRAVLSGKVQLVQETDAGVQAGVLLYHPVYGTGPAPASVAERRRRLVGWVYMPFRMGDLMRGTFGERGPELAISIHDGAVSGGGTLLFDSEAAGPGAQASPWLELQRPLAVAGRTWTLVVRTLPAFGARQVTSSGTAVVFGGLAVALLLAALAWLLARGRDRAVQAARAMNRDLLEAHARLQAREAQLRAYFQSPGVGIIVSSTGELPEEINDRACQLLGHPREELLRIPWRELTHPEDVLADAAGLDRLRSGAADSFSVDKRFVRQDGSVVWTMVSVSCVRRGDRSIATYVAVLEDIGERKRAEAERATLLAGLAQAERAAALGTLAAGMAHEINNPLTPVLAGIDFVKDQLGALPGPLLSAWEASVGTGLDEVQGALDDAAKGARRVRDLVADLRSFALGQHAADSTCDLQSALVRAARVAHYALGDGTDVTIDLPALPSVAGSEAELVQLFGCLLVNAEQAGGDRPNLVRVTAERRGPMVQVRVSDTGQGIPAELLPRIFEPFFTTRKVGEGKGLGLPVARGIAQGLGGQVEVASVVGAGTTVSVTLPVAPGA